MKGTKASATASFETLGSTLRSVTDPLLVPISLFKARAVHSWAHESRESRVVCAAPTFRTFLTLGNQVKKHVAYQESAVQLHEMIDEALHLGYGGDLSHVLLVPKQHLSTTTLMAT